MFTTSFTQPNIDTTAKHSIPMSNCLRQSVSFWSVGNYAIENGGKTK